jgi:hypothetical protein
MVSHMEPAVNEATEALLDAFGTDLQRQLGRSAIVECLLVREAPGTVTLAATVRVAARELELIGHGENLLTAYADLTRRAPGPILSSAFRQVVEA